MNRSAPDPGNMEILHHFAMGAVRDERLKPFFAGDICSVCSMTEPLVAPSDAHATSLEIAEDSEIFRLNHCN